MPKPRSIFWIATIVTAAYVVWRWQKQRLNELNQNLLNEASFNRSTVSPHGSGHSAPATRMSSAPTAPSSLSQNADSPPKKRRVINTTVHKGEPPKVAISSEPHFGEAKVVTTLGKQSVTKTIDAPETLLTPEPIPEPAPEPVAPPAPEPEPVAQAIFSEEAESASSEPHTSSEKTTDDTAGDTSSDEESSESEDSTQDTTTDEKDQNEEETGEDKPTPKRTTRSSSTRSRRRTSKGSSSSSKSSPSKS